jgi:hypothetical protein
MDNISHENIISNLKTENDKLQTEIKELMENKSKIHQKWGSING